MMLALLSSPPASANLPFWFGQTHRCDVPLVKIRGHYNWLRCPQCQYLTLGNPASPTYNWTPHWTALEVAMMFLAQFGVTDPRHGAWKELADGPDELARFSPCAGCEGSPPFGFQCLTCRRKGVTR